MIKGIEGHGVSGEERQDRGIPVRAQHSVSRVRGLRAAPSQSPNIDGAASTIQKEKVRMKKLLACLIVVIASTAAAQNAAPRRPLSMAYILTQLGSGESPERVWEDVQRNKLARGPTRAELEELRQKGASERFLTGIQSPVAIAAPEIVSALVQEDRERTATEKDRRLRDMLSGAEAERAAQRAERKREVGVDSLETALRNQALVISELQEELVRLKRRVASLEVLLHP